MRGSNSGEEPPGNIAAVDLGEACSAQTAITQPLDVRTIARMRLRDPSHDPNRPSSVSKRGHEEVDGSGAAGCGTGQSDWVHGDGEARGGRASGTARCRVVPGADHGER